MSNELKFTVTEQEANIILASLGKQPAEMVMAVILKLQEQARRQAESAVENQ